MILQHLHSKCEHLKNKLTLYTHLIFVTVNCIIWESVRLKKTILQTTKTK